MRRLAAAPVVVGGLAQCSPAFAETVAVVPQCTLSQAVTYADGSAPESGCGSGPFPPVTIMVPASTSDYVAASTLDVTASMTIEGAGPTSTIISGSGRVQVFDVQGQLSIGGTYTPSVTIEGVTSPTG